MADQKKQKVVLGVVAALALGAGAYFFVLGDSSGPAKNVGASGPVERKKAAATEAPKVARKSDPKANLPKAEVAPVERKEREVTEDTSVERKKRRTEKQETKKKNVSPAA